MKHQTIIILASSANSNIKFTFRARTARTVMIFHTSHYCRFNRSRHQVVFLLNTRPHPSKFLLPTRTRGRLIIIQINRSSVIMKVLKTTDHRSYPGGYLKRIPRYHILKIDYRCLRRKKNRINMRREE